MIPLNYICRYLVAETAAPWMFSLTALKMAAEHCTSADRRARHFPGLFYNAENARKAALVRGSGVCTFFALGIRSSNMNMIIRHMNRPLVPHLAHVIAKQPIITLNEVPQLGVLAEVLDS